MRDPLQGLFDEPDRSPQIRIGTQGLSAGAWVGSFYPPQLRPAEQIPFYGRVFDTAELNTTFYSIPSRRTARSWERRSPPDFIFAAKFPQIITHEKKLIDCQGEVESFLSVMTLLGEKLGPLLIQLPPEMTDYELDSLTEFLEMLPSQDLDFALEVRSRTLQSGSVLRVLGEKRIAWCITQWRSLPVVAQVTADFTYIRLVGSRDDVRDEDLNALRIDRSAEVRAWANTIRGLSQECRRIYVYVNNHYSGHAPATANQLKRLLGLPWVEPVDLWREPPQQAHLGLDTE